MKGFFIKKAFFDGWDNLIAMVVLNLIYVAFFLALLGALTLFGSMNVFAYVLLLLIIFLWCLAKGGVAGASYEWSNYKSSTFSAFKEGFVRNIRHSLLYFGLMVVEFLMFIVVLPFYAGMQGVFPLIVSVILFWVELIFLMAIPYYFPLMSRLPGDRPLKTLKKCFIVMADNIGFSVFLLFYNIICLVLTLSTFGLIPGVAGMQLAKQDAVKLIMFKYDYMEENADADRKHIPWDDLLYEEREKVGPRSLKSMIFPWK